MTADPPDNYFQDQFEYFNHFNIDNLPNIIWKRPGEIVDDPCLLETYDAEIDGHLICGSVTPLWFPVLLTVVREKEQLDSVMRNIKLQDNFNSASYDGSFEFCFYGRNSWTTLRIDDRLPLMSDDGRHLFCVSSNKEEFLAPLMEKAYARYVGGYGKFQSVHFFEALMHFTGGIIEKVDVMQNLNPLTYQEQKLFFKKIKSLPSNIIAICVSNDCQDVDSDSSENVKPSLPINHYYLLTGCTVIPANFNSNIINIVVSSVLDFNNHESIDMIRMRNPVSSGDWSGSFSVGSLEWEAISENVRRHFNLNFNHELEFWMSMDDFNRNIAYVAMCHIPSQSYFKKLFRNMDMWYSICLRGKYSSITLGDSLETSVNEFLQNDQYIIEILNENSVDVKFVLSVDHADNGFKFQNGCGLELLKVENNRCYKLHDISNSEKLNLKILSQTDCTYSASISLFKGRYLLIPWRKGLVDIEYFLRIYSSNRSINVSVLKEDKPRFIKCLKCNLVKTLVKTKDMIINFSQNSETIETKSSKVDCNFCLSINPEMAIRITILSASGIELNDDNSHRSTYFVLKFSDYVYKSNTKFLTNNPTWNESFIIYQTSKRRDMVSIEVFSQQKIGFDKSLGVHVFTGPDFYQSEISVTLKTPVNKEWIYTSVKVLVLFKKYLPVLFDTI